MAFRYVSVIPGGSRCFDLKRSAASHTSEEFEIFQIHPFQRLLPPKSGRITTKLFNPGPSTLISQSVAAFSCSGNAIGSPAYFLGKPRRDRGPREIFFMRLAAPGGERASQHGVR